jgi:hypothetical protein
VRLRRAGAGGIPRPGKGLYPMRPDQGNPTGHIIRVLTRLPGCGILAPAIGGCVRRLLHAWVDEKVKVRKHPVKIQAC